MPENPYSPPAAGPPGRRNRWIIFSGAALVLIGLGLTGLALFLLIGSFQDIEKRAAPAPRDLAAGVYRALGPASAGIPALLAGIMLLLVGLLHRRREPRAGTEAPLGDLSGIDRS